MEYVVPSTLQRLRAADVIRMAGLNAASQGQEYSRMGVVHDTQRRGAALSGIITTSPSALTMRDDEDEAPEDYIVEVEALETNSCVSTCTCGTSSTLLCAHAAALLYQWLAHSDEFVIQPGAEQSEEETTSEMLRQVPAVEQISAKLARPVAIPVKSPVTTTGAVSWDLVDLFVQMSLSELRNIAREYETVINGLNRQQLAETLAGILRQPDVVRRIAATLEKAPRQLLAAVTLAGGTVSDDDLRGLFERFGLGQPPQLQHALFSLQRKALLFRTSLNASGLQRTGLSGALLDIHWYVPLEVRSALRVTVPPTVFSTERTAPEQQIDLQQTCPYRLLNDLLLVARALDGYHTGPGSDWQERVANIRALDMPGGARSGGDGSTPVPAPADTVSTAVIDFLCAQLPRPPDILRFAVRMLRLADILYQDDEDSSSLRTLPHIAELLLGPHRAEAARDLFNLWITQSSYAELYDLQEEGVSLRCRATALNVPMLRTGELDAENKDARQTLISLLAQVPSLQWVNFSAFARFVWRLHPLFLQCKQRQYASPHWWIEREPGHPLRPLHVQEWFQAEALYLSRLLCGPFSWWGACDIARARDGRLLAFRLTPVAQWLFSGIHNDAEKEENRDYHRPTNSLEIVDTEEVRVACHASLWPAIASLEMFAQAAGVSGEQLRYLITPKALGDALRQGNYPSELLSLLRPVAERSSQPGSLWMVEQLERWIASYGRVRLYTGVTLLETVDTVVMRELSATTTLDEQVVQTIHPTLHIVKKSGAEHVMDELKRRGQPALLHEEDVYGAE